ncbi:Wzz/FepE/Etk N-terminal domain-containing protein [Teredinibacter waterburyi]|uniref:Wzz/FepE/Etk N-terminal domain-containing protein n=1 Tax=Teredinibacter waterburyi TaxID=1500538 RepID=UPI00165FC0E0|nr:Wzz/FepE/Etk N-terminal domain-containing protein [Teredinibacter waterburyi]
MEAKTPGQTESGPELDKRLTHIEQQLDTVVGMTAQQSRGFNFQSHGGAEEIDLLELWNVIWQGKWLIIATTFLFAVAAVFYAISLPNMYKSEGVYAPAQEEGGLGGLAAKYGGLAAMAGINIGGGESGDIEQAMALVKSWPFIENFVNKYQLKPYIMGVKKWNQSDNALVWDKDIYNPTSRQWLRDPPKGKQAEPSSFEVFEEFSAMLNANHDVKTGLITIGVEHYSPILAAAWTNNLVKELNNHFQQRDMVDAKKNIEYLNQKINETGIAEMQTVFYSMIEEQTKSLMLAEVSDEYLAKTVIEPQVAELKSKPKRSLIVMLATILGGMFGVLTVLIKHFSKSEFK